MVIGSGMLASVFTQFKSRKDLIIFASGVSNSTANDKAAFQREEQLLRDSIKKGCLMVYFSTTSLLDPSLFSSPYVLHKKAMEKLVASFSTSFLIVRLPLVVGPSSNPNTLVNFLYNSIKTGRPFTVYSKACRHLIALEDVKEAVTLLLEDSGRPKRSVNVCFDNLQSVKEIVSELETLMNKKGNYELEERGECVEVDNALIKDDPRFAKFFNRRNYNTEILRKYVSAQ